MGRPRGSAPFLQHGTESGHFMPPVPFTWCDALQRMRANSVPDQSQRGEG